MFFSSTFLSLSFKFLLSVTRYTVSTAVLALQHSFQLPSSSKTIQDTVTALVDVKLLSESLKLTDIQEGEWLNVIGYVDTVSSRKAGKPTRINEEKVALEVKIDAVMLWSAGAVMIDKYESALQGRKPSS